MNGKTLGRLKPAPDRSVIEETIRGHEEVQADIANGAELLTSRERSLHRDNIDLKRQLDVERNRVAVLMANGGKPTLRPIASDMERVAEFERRIVAMGDMTDEARLAESRRLFDDVKAYQKNKSEWLAEVDAQTSRNVEAGAIIPRSNWVKER